MKPSILVLCTGNSCRSHMAEGILQKALGDDFRVVSAGSNPAGYVHPLAIEALSEIGIDISANTSKHLDEFLEDDIETVITVCGRADQVCPTFPGQVRRYHWVFDDPADANGTTEEGDGRLEAECLFPTVIRCAAERISFWGSFRFRVWFYPIL